MIERRAPLGKHGLGGLTKVTASPVTWVGSGRGNVQRVVAAG
jgi:hypothetical protein